MEEITTTNKVLETKLDGFKELTDTKFKNIESSLSRIENSIGTFVTTQQLEDVKKEFNKSILDIQKGFEQHNLDDKESFNKLIEQNDQLKNKMQFWMGALAMLSIVIGFLSPIIMHYIFKI